MKSIFLTGHLILMLISPYGNAQEIEGIDAQENLFKLGGSEATIGIVRKFDNRYEGVKGSPFYFDSWSNGSIKMENGRRIENLQLKYNAYEDELLLKNAQRGPYYIPKKDIHSFTLIQTKSRTPVNFLKYRHPRKENQQQFYRWIREGRVSLLELIKVVFEKADFEGGYSNDKRHDEFKKYSAVYYFIDSEPVLKKLKTNPSGVSRMFPDHKDEIKAFIRNKKLDCQNENDLLKILDYYDRIQ